MNNLLTISDYSKRNITLTDYSRRIITVDEVFIINGYLVDHEGFMLLDHNSEPITE